jgi:ATP-dependent Clp protease ATP-binding subunit ClpC
MRRFYRGLIRRADEEATALGHEYIGAQHLLLAIAAEGDGPAARTLAAAGVEAGAIRAVLRQWEPPEPDPVLGSPLPLAPSAQRALESAGEWVRRLRPGWPRREHLLLGILETQDGVMPLLLDELGARAEVIRAALLEEHATRA